MAKCPNCNGTGVIKSEPTPTHWCQLRVQHDDQHGEMDDCREPAVIQYNDQWLCEGHAENIDARVKKRKQEISKELRDIREWQRVKRSRK